MKSIYKRVIIFMTALLFVFIFVGCNNQQNKNDNVLSVEEAKTIAYNHAGVSSNDIVLVIAEYDNDRMIPHYDIEFTVNGYEYDYEINAATGAILEFEKELEDDKKSEIDSSNFITAEKAKEISLNHAGLLEKDITNYKCELDRDDLIPHYEVEFNSGKYEYEYEINAKNGNIMFSEKEIDN